MLRKIEAIKIKQVALKGWCRDFEIDTKRFNYIEINKNIIVFINKRRKTKLAFPKHLISIDLKSGEKCA